MFHSVQSVIFVGILVADFAVAAYVLAQRPGHSVHRSFFTVVAGIVAWGIGFILSERCGWSELSNLLIMYGGITFIAGFAVFARMVPHGNPVPRRFWLILVPMGIAAVLLPTNLIISAGSIVNGVVRPENGPLFPVFAAVCVGYMLYGISRLVRTYRSSEPYERHRLKYFFLGFGLFILVSLAADLVLPVFRIFFLNILGPVSSIILVVATAYAILRHNILDIRFVFQRGFVYTTLVSGLVGTYVLLILLIGRVFHAGGDLLVLASAGIAMVLGVLGAGPFDRMLRRRTDPWFFKDRYDYGAALHRLSRIANTAVTKREIIERSEQELVSLFKAKSASVFLGTIIPPRLLGPSARRTEVCVPLIFEETRIGLLIVGEKRSGDSYTTEDLRLVETFGYQAAVALEKARLYEEVREYSVRLEEQVADRTRKIESLLEEQRQSMFDLSHSLQTPLAVLANQVELLEGTSVDPGILSTCRKSIQGVSGFVRRLLHLVSLESRHDGDSMRRFDLSGLLNDNRDYLETMVEADGLHILFQVAPSVSIVGDEGLVEELLMSLVTNAIKYTRPKVSAGGDGFVGVSLSSDDGTAVLSVSDNGIGIARSEFESIFRRFYRASSGDRSVRGNGLGLAICRRIADIHDAAIAVESVPGEGATFTVRFPEAIP